MSITEQSVPSPRAETDPGCVSIDYVNWRGERSLRRIVPQRLYRGEVEWHPGCQWLLDAWDTDKGAMRTFAMTGIQQWDVD